MIFRFNDAVFGKNDIRGIYGETITPELFTFVGKAYAKYILEKLAQSKKENEEIWVSVGRDARTHSPGLANSLIEGLVSSGINVLDLGLCPTPLAYYSEVSKIPKSGSSSQTDCIGRVKSNTRPKDIKLVGTLIITASHNPSQYNGLKMTFRGSSLNEDEIKALREITKEVIKDESGEKTDYGFCKKYNIISNYTESLVNSFSKIGEGIKIVVDSGNATAGIVAPELYRELGCEVIDICTEPDGDFPNHHPNPSDEKTLIMLKEKIEKTGADFGIAFDGDSDRVGIVDNTGYSIPGDQLLLIFALDILHQLKIRNEKPVFVSEVKCSQVLYDLIEQHGGQAIMWKTGHGFIKSKMKQENAVLAGEMSGHIFFRDRYYGFDDAIYAGCRFIEIVAKNKNKKPDFKVSDLIAELPKAFTSREVRHPCPDELKQKVLADLKKKIEQQPDIFGSKIEKIITIDGLRVVFNNGFALIRASNTEPTFTLRFEASNKEDLENYKNTMLSHLEETMNKHTETKTGGIKSGT